VWMFGTGKRNHGKPVREGCQVLLQLVRRPARGDEVEFVEIKAPVGGAGDGKMTVVDGSKEPPKIAIQRGWCFAAVRCACAVVNEAPKKVLTAQIESRPRTIYVILSRIFFFVRGDRRAVNRRG